MCEPSRPPPPKGEKGKKEKKGGERKCGEVEMDCCREKGAKGGGSSEFEHRLEAKAAWGGGGGAPYC